MNTEYQSYPRRSSYITPEHAPARHAFFPGAEPLSIFLSIYLSIAGTRTMNTNNKNIHTEYQSYPRRSSYITPEHAPAMHAFFPGAEADGPRMVEAGHWVHAERPDEFVALVEGFCEGG